MVTISISKDSAKGMVKRLREFLREGGNDLKQTHAYEALARMLGYRNWNTLEAALSGESTAINTKFKDGSHRNDVLAPRPVNARAVLSTQSFSKEARMSVEPVYPDDFPIDYPRDTLEAAISSGFKSVLVDALREDIQARAGLEAMRDRLIDDGLPVPADLTRRIKHADSEAHDTASDLAGDMAYEEAIRG